MSRRLAAITLQKIVERIKHTREERTEAFRKLKAGEPMTLRELFLVGH